MVLIPAQGWGDPYTKAGGSWSLPSEFQNIQAYPSTGERRIHTQRQLDFRVCQVSSRTSRPTLRHCGEVGRGDTQRQRQTERLRDTDSKLSTY